jgi:hypothetical protein
VNWGVQKHILAGFAVALVVIFATFVISYRNTESLIETSQLVAQRENLLIELERTLSAVKDIQSGQRGYALSGNPDMLEAYRIGREEMPGLLRRLERFTAGNPEEQQQVAILQ